MCSSVVCRRMSLLARRLTGNTRRDSEHPAVGESCVGECSHCSVCNWSTIGMWLLFVYVCLGVTSAPLS